MPLTAAQICTRAASIARVPGFLSQAGQSLNVVLQELCQDYDFEICKNTYNFNFNPSQLNSLSQCFQNLPTDYLRSIRNETFYVIMGVPYPMIDLDQAEGDMLVQLSNNQSYPIFYWTNLSGTGDVNNGTVGVPVMLFWMVPSGAYPVTLRYYRQFPDIVTPETSSVVPWFPNQNYLITRVAGELMKDADDERATAYLTDNEEENALGAGVILRKYLKMKDDKGSRAITVQLDRRRFGRAFDRLKNTKTIGW